jgi:hypothetical protein
MGLRLQRSLGPLGDIKPGQYAVDEPCVFVSCPACGCVDDVSVSQPPDVGGVLGGGEWKCPTVTCSFKSFLSLDCWNEEPHR